MRHRPPRFERAAGVAVALLTAFLAGTALSAAAEARPRSTPQVTQVPTAGFDPVVEAPLALDEAGRRYLLWFARQTCGGGEVGPPQVPPPSLAAVNRPIIVTIFHADGQRRVRRRVDGEAHIARKLEGVMPELCAGLDPAAARQHRIHLMVVTRTVRTPNFGFKSLFQNKVFEAQVMGVAFEWKGRRTERDPIEQAMYNHGPKSVRRAMMKDLGEKAIRLSTANDLIIELYEVAHFGETGPELRFTDYFRGLERLSPDQVTPALLDRRIRLIGEWYRNNVRTDGQVTYTYYPSTGKEDDAERTMVRSTMAVWVLNRLAEFLDDDHLRRLGLRGIDYYRERYFQMSTSKAAGRIVPSTEPLRNGNLVANRYTVASFIAGAMMERPDYAQRRDEIELLLSFAMSQQRPDGVMWTQFANSQYFMPGQLLLIVSYAAEKLGGDRYQAFFDRTMGVYSAALQGQMALAPGLWVPYAPAWYTQPAAHMYLRTKAPELAELVFQINDRVVKHHAYNALEQRHYDYDGAMTPKRGYYGNNSVTAASLESLADAAVVARAAGDQARFERYRTAIRHIVAYLLRLQYTPANTYWVRDKARVTGGFKTDLLNNKLWMDNVWHLTSAFIKIRQHELL